jgi:glycosyltransferase involved in cell wall biosynthesis
MTWDAVHQFVPTLPPGDAIGGHVLWIRNRLRIQGYKSEIFVGTENPRTAKETHDLATVDQHVTSNSQTLFLYHVAQASPCADFLLDRQEPLALVFHNFTPPELLIHWDPDVAFELLRAQEQLTDLVAKSQFAICDSRFNALTLASFGDLATSVVPLPLQNNPRPVEVTRQRPIVLFVGRVAPNKAVHDLITAAALLKENVPDTELRIVGGPTSDLYEATLDGLVKALGLGDIVTFTGWIDDEQLELEYRRASVFCTLSDHEGFGVPIAEAMSYGLPVVAYANTAVTETVGDGGLLLHSKSPALVATALEKVLVDEGLANRLSTSGYRRVMSFNAELVGNALDQAIRHLSSQAR